MNSNSKPTCFSSSIRNPQSPIPNPKCSSRLSPSTSRALTPDLRPLTPDHRPPASGLSRPAAFTLVELLVVISIIGLLAGLAVPAINGAMKSAKKAEVGAVAQSIRTAIIAWNSEYGTWPTNGLTGDSSFQTTTAFLNMMTTTNSADNPRGIIFLEVPAKFTNSSGIVTPTGFIKGSQSNFRFAIDNDGDGSLSGVGFENTSLRTAVAVWAPDPSSPTTKSVGTWK